MKKLFKKVVALALCVFMGTALFACNGGSDSTSPSGGDTPSTGELTFDENGKVVFNNVTIRLDTVVWGEDVGAFDAIVGKFNLLYDGKIAINYTHISPDNFENTVANKIQNNNGAPDLIMSHQKSHKNFADVGYIQPLDGIIKDSGIEIDMSNYATGLAQYTKHGTNSLYSVPVDAQSHVVLYNKEELAKTGMALPTNRDELIAVCQAYKNATGKAPIAWVTGGDYFANYVYVTALVQNGLELYDEKTFMTDWYSNEANRTSIVNGNESVRELIRSGYANYNESDSSTLTRFMNGNALFYFTDPWKLGNFVDEYSAQKGCNVTTLFDQYLGGVSMSNWFALTENDQQNAIFGDSHFFAMTKCVTDITKKAAILEFIKWFTTDAQAGADWARAGHVSVSKSIIDTDTYANDIYVVNLIDKFYGDIDNFVCVGSTPHFATIISNLKGLFSDVVNDDTLKSGYNVKNDEGLIKSRQDAANNQISFFG